MDETLENVSLLHKSQSMMKLTSSSRSTSTTESETDPEDEETLGHDSRCPWREYAKMAKMAPKGAVTICTLRHLLLPEGCTPMEFGLCLLELDEKNVGYFYKDVFRRKGVAAILKHTQLAEARAQAIVDAYVDSNNLPVAVERLNALQVSA